MYKARPVQNYVLVMYTYFPTLQSSSVNLCPDIVLRCLTKGVFEKLSMTQT